MKGDEETTQWENEVQQRLLGAAALTTGGGARRARRREQREHAARVSPRRMKRGDPETRLSSFHLGRNNES